MSVEYSKSHHPITQSETDFPQTSDTEEDRNLHECLQLFDFSTPITEKQTGNWRMFYNNCNGIEANTMIKTYIQQKRDKRKYNYLKDMDIFRLLQIVI